MVEERRAATRLETAGPTEVVEERAEGTRLETAAACGYRTPLDRHVRDDHSIPWTYILRCADDSYYVGSTSHLEYRLWQHQSGEGAQHTK